MRKSKRLTSMPVISLEDGQQIGFVKGLVVDPAGKKVAALIVEQKGWFKEQRFIPYHKVKSVGNDAITIEKASSVDRASGLPDIVRLLKDKVGITGAKIVAENGTVLGFVDEYYVDLSAGSIAGLEFSGNFLKSVIKGRAFLDISYVRTLGKEVAVVTSEGAEHIFKLDGGLQETVKNIKESTGQIWGNTVQKTKELGASFNKSLEKVKKDKKSWPYPYEDNTDAAMEEKRSGAPEKKEQPGTPAVMEEETVVTTLPEAETEPKQSAPPPA